MIDAEKFQTMERVAEKLFRGGVFSAEVKSADTAFAIILAGDEMGYEPMAAARAFALVKGKVSLSADALIGLVKRSAQCEAWRVVETTATECTITTKRAGDDMPTALTYTIAMATRAGLTGSQTWRAHPEAMLRARCGAALARAVYPDVCGGLYEPDEAEEIRRGGKSHAADEPRDDAPAQPAPVDALDAFRAALDGAESLDLDGARRVYAAHDLGGTSLSAVTVAVVGALAVRGYRLTGMEAGALLRGELPDALALAYDRLAAIDRHADDADGDGVVADVVRVLRASGSLPKAAKARLLKVAAQTIALELQVSDADAAARLDAALRPPPPPTGTDAPAANDAAASAHGDAIAAAQTAGAQACAEVRVELDADETERRLVSSATAWAAYLARLVDGQAPVFAIAGSHHKRREAFDAAGVLSERRAQTLAAIEAREQRGPDAARECLDGYATRRIMPPGIGAVIRLPSREQRRAARTGTDG